MEISLAGIAFVVLIGVLLPRAAYKSHRALTDGAPVPPLRKLLLGAIVTQLVLAAIAIGVAKFDGITLFPPPRVQGLHLGVAAGALALALVMIPLRWKYKSDDDMRRLAMLVPSTLGDLPYWVCVSLAAGICEEIVYRGVLFQVLDRALHHLSWEWWPAAILSSVAFGLGHVVQGRSAVAIVLLFSLVFHGLVRLTGDLYYAMAVHFLYDLIAGVVLWKLVGSLKQQVDAQKPPGNGT